MTVFLLRIFIYTILPLLIASAFIALDKSIHNRVRRLEIFLVYLFGLGVAGSGIGGFFGHFFLSDQVAESIGWETGNPFQLEVGFANLAMGVLGIVATGRRDGFREATVIAGAVFSVGATIVHIMDVLQTGNLAPGNTLQNVNNLLRPALLIGFLAASRRAERSPEAEVHKPHFEIWRGPRVMTAGVMTISVATGFGVGFGIERPVIGTFLGIALGALISIFIVTRSAGGSAGLPGRQSHPSGP